ncbi:MAG: aminodeoxychorismate/anthranilate synthase component II [Syntrophaceae bacterium]|nr:aminodeoxychorismate/anthranilate synthase component II [Syntrophaceae bacterium]
MKMKQLLVIDNYDSFTYNLVQMFMCHTLNIHVHRSDHIILSAAAALKPDYLVISPGPKDPRHSGISVGAIRCFCRKIPILGVCLGMQAVNEAFGGQTMRSALPVHGKTSIIHHQGMGLFKGIPSPFRAMRYHSLITTDCPAELVVTARTSDGTAMGLSHRKFPIHGVQFHPESFRTEYGETLIENFLRLG